MLDWFEIFIWGAGFAVLHEGTARAAQNSSVRSTGAAIVTGMLVLLAGAVFWYGSALSFERLSEAQQIPTLRTDLSSERKDIENISPLQRKEVSFKLAKMAFANGDDDVKVLADDGRWIPFEPDDQDLKARGIQLRMLDEIRQRRQDLHASAIAAERDSKRWLISFLIAVFTGLISGVFLRKPVEKLG